MDKRLKKKELPYVLDVCRQLFNFKTGEMFLTNNTISLSNGQIIGYSITRGEKFEEKLYKRGFKREYYLNSGRLNELPKFYRTIQNPTNPNLQNIHPDDLPTTASLNPSFYPVCKYELKETKWKYGRVSTDYLYKRT